MDNIGGNKLLYFLAGVAVGGIIVYSARSPQMRGLLAKAAGKGLKLKEDADHYCELVFDVITAALGVKNISNIDSWWT